MQVLSNGFNEDLPWELQYADDLILVAESEEQLRRKIALWKKGIEDKGLRVNIAKTKIMKCEVGKGPTEDSGKHTCGVCRKGVGVNSVWCKTCERWIHKK